MNLVSTFIRSLLLAALASFLAPIVVLGSVCFGMQIWTYLPGVGGLGLAGSHYIADFLTVFGNGSPVGGVITIAIVCAAVGVMFDTYVFYHAQTQKDHYGQVPPQS
jgi:hypothetical protein